MKNIERPEANEVFFELLIGVKDRNRAILELKKLGLKSQEGIVSNYDLWKWLEEEYEPHKWEPWELEAMRNIPKRIVYLERRHDTSLPRALQKDDCYADHGICTQINFPSLKNEKIDIDAELERNGMHR